MTDTILVPPGERGTVRVFAVDLPPEEARTFAADPAALGRALGAPGLDPEYADVFPVSRVAALGLPAFLSEGHGIAPDDLAPDARRLDALDGHVAVIASRAFGAGGQTLTVAPPLRLVGTYSEDRQPVTFGALPSGGAEGVLGRPAAPSPAPPARRGRSARFLTVAILIVAILGFILLNGGR